MRRSEYLPVDFGELLLRSLGAAIDFETAEIGPSKRVDLHSLRTVDASLAEFFRTERWNVTGNASPARPVPLALKF